MDLSKFIKRMLTRGNLYLWLIGLMGAAALLLRQWALGAAELAAFAALLLYQCVHNRKQTDAVFKMVDTITLDVNTAAKSSLMNFPLPTVMLTLSGEITWYNERFHEIFKSVDRLFGKRIEELAEGLDLDRLVDLENKTIDTQVACQGRTFRVIGNVSMPEDGNYVVALYWEELTEYLRLKERFRDERVFVAQVLLDNFDELMQNTKESGKPQLQAQIGKAVRDWAERYGGLLYGYERDRYLALFEYRSLEAMTREKFPILTQLRAIDEGNRFPVTASIGIGVDGANLLEDDRHARAAINMALGRGGDQVVIKDSKQFRFYGGNGNEHEKSTRVKARVVSFALRGLINNADNVVIMGHKNVDIDCFGAAFGIQRACKQVGKPVHILLDAYDDTVKNMLARMENDEEYTGLFLTNQQAEEMVGENTLLIVVDTHKPDFVENRTILEKTQHIVVIDHHRRSAEFIENTALIYHEPYASSACEMVTEILQYIDDRVELKKLEAEAIYAGIVIDTKHFTFKTGVRTFEAASFLRRYGVDTVAIKTMFQEDLTTFVKKAEIIKNAKILLDHIAISRYRCESASEEYQSLVAQAADEMLNIKGITASFVLCDTRRHIAISGRSLGSINVQVILEKLGGGGHLTIAGAQLRDVSLEEANARLEGAIEDYFNESIS